MQSVCGLDLVSGALKSTLARAQQNYDFSSPNNKNHLKNLKKNASLKDGQGGEWDSGRDSVFNHWNIAIKSNNLQFAPSGYQLSSFIETIRSKYECLNPSKVEISGSNVFKRLSNTKSKFVTNKLKGKSKADKCGVIQRTITAEDGKAKKSILKEVTCDNTKDDDSKPKQRINLNELYQQVKEGKKESRKRKKELRKLARLKKLQLTQPHLFKPDEALNRETKKNSNKTIQSKENTNKFNLISKLNNKKRGMKETMENSVINGGDNASPSQLSQPRVVLYPRSKVVPGWKTRVPVGCGLINLGNSCYMNASLQALFHTPAFVNWLMDDNEHRQNCRNLGQSFQSCLICAMNNTLRESLNRQIQCMRPLQIHNKLKVICKHFTHGRQEDAHEFLRYLLESMERSYLAAINSLRLDNRSKDTTPLGQIFGGYLRTEVTCLKCNFISTTFQPLAELQLDIRHVTTLEDAIQNHFKKERLDNNDYKCEKCHTISPATKQFSLEIPPIVLCLQLKRFTLFGNKITKPIHCNRSLNLTRYLHKSLQEVDQVEIKYRLVALVTHMGSSPNCGHYTAIAEASNGNFYQFDDSYVRQVSVQTALNTDAYVIIYEMDRNQNHPVVTTNGNTNGLGMKSSTVTSTSPVTVNGNTSNGGRIGSPVPVSKRLNVPFLKSPASVENSALKAATLSSPTTTNSFVNGGSNHSLINSSKLLNGHYPNKPGGNSQNRDRIFDDRQAPTQSVSYNGTPKINILKPGVGLTNSRLITNSISRTNNTSESSSSYASSNGLEKRPKSPSLHSNSSSKYNGLTNGASHAALRQSIQLVPYESDERPESGMTPKMRNKDQTPEKLINEQLYPETPPKSPTISPLSLDKSKLTKNFLTSKSQTNATEQLIPTLQVETQSGVKRKLDDTLNVTGTESKQPRLAASASNVESIRLNGDVNHAVSSTSNWKVIANCRSSIGSTSKPTETIHKFSKSGHSSDPESKLNSSSNTKYVDFHRAKSVERLFHSQNNRNDLTTKGPTEKGSNILTSKTPEKQRKSPVLEPVCSTSPFSRSYEPLIERTVDSPSPVKVTSISNINGHAKIKEQKIEKRDGIHISSKTRSRSSSSSMSSSDSSSDEKHKRKSTKHKKKQKKPKHKKKKSKKHKKSSSNSSSSGSDSESEELLETKHKSGPMKLIDKMMALKKKNKSSKKHKRKKEDRSPETASTELSEDGKRSLLKTDVSESTSTELIDAIRSLSEERERDRRKNRNPSRSPDRTNCPRERNEEKFDVHKITSRDQQIVGWNGTVSALSKSIDSERKHLVRKNKDELFDEEVDFGRVKKSKKSVSSQESETGNSGNKFQNYEDKKKEVFQWSKLLNGYGDNFRGENKYEKSNGKSSSGSSENQGRKGFPYRSGHSPRSGYSGSYSSHHNNRSNGQFRNGKGGRGSFGRNHSERNHHRSSYHRDKRERRPS